MTTTQAEFFQTNAIDGKLTPQQAAELLELPMGDTSAQLDNGGVPSSTPAATNPNGDVQAGNGDTNNGALSPELDPANTVILAKDGKHTIGYEKLVEAREGEKHWKAQYDATQQRLAALEAAASERAAAGVAPTQADNQAAAATAAIAQGVDPEIFGDFSEEALAAGIQKLVDQRVSAALAPLQQKQAKDATSEHYSAIYDAHPDADSIAESKELADWIGSQPSFVRDGYQAVLAKGSTAQIVELFDSFKQAAGITPAAAAASTDVKAAAKAALARASAGAVPVSLSDIPGGRPAATSQFEALDQMSGPALLDAMESMSAVQREAFLNRQL